MSQKWIARLTQKIEELTAKNGGNSDNDESDDLKTIMTEEEKSVLEQYPKGSFLHLFWQHNIMYSKRRER